MFFSRVGEVCDIDYFINKSKNSCFLSVQQKNTIIMIHLDFQQSVPITTKIVSSKPVHGEVYSIQHYVIKFVSDLQQVGDFLQVLRFHPLIKLTAMI